MELFLLYLFTRLDAIQVLLIVSLVAFSLFTLILFPVIGEAYEEKKEGWKKIQKKSGIAVLVLALFVGLLPDQKSAAIIMGGWAVLEVAKSETAQRLASKNSPIASRRANERR